MRHLVASVSLALALRGVPARAESQTFVVDCVAGPYTTIQGAIDDLFVSGDYHAVIAVHPCVYNENLMLQELGYVHLVAAEGPNHRGTVGAIGLGVAGGVRRVAEISGVGLPGPCITAEGTYNLTVQGFVLSDCPVGIRLDDAYDTIIAGNRMRRHSQWAIESITYTTQLQIVGNTIAYSGGGIYGSEGFELSVADNRIGFITGIGALVDTEFPVFLNNHFREITGHSMLIGDGNPFMSTGFIARNTFDGSVAPRLVEISSTSDRITAVANVGATFVDAGTDSIITANE